MTFPLQPWSGKSTLSKTRSLQERWTTNEWLWAVFDMSLSNVATDPGQNWDAFFERREKAVLLVLSHHISIDGCSPHLHQKCPWVWSTAMCLENYANFHRFLNLNFRSQMELLYPDGGSNTRFFKLWRGANGISVLQVTKIWLISVIHLYPSILHIIRFVCLYAWQGQKCFWITMNFAQG